MKTNELTSNCVKFSNILLNTSYKKQNSLNQISILALPHLINFFSFSSDHKRQPENTLFTKNITNKNHGS